MQTKNDYPQSYVEELLNIIKKVKPETTKEDIIKWYMLHTMSMMKTKKY